MIPYQNRPRRTLILFLLADAKRTRGPRSGANRMGVGNSSLIYAPDEPSQATDSMAARETALGYGYASGQEAVAHFRLGELTACDIEIILPNGKGRFEQTNVKDDQRIALKP